MAYYTTPCRTALAMVFLVHLCTGLTWKQAHKAVREKGDMKSVLPEIEDKEKQQWRRMQKAAIRVGRKLIAVGAVYNRKRKQKLSSITPDEAKLASMLLKTGWMEYQHIGGRHITTKHHYFTSLKTALLKSRHLRDIYKKFIGPNLAKKRWQFMQQLYKHDPLLRIRRRHTKYAYSGIEMENRFKRAKSLLARDARDPDFLKRVFFVDECSIIFDHEIRKGVHVYCDAHDKGYRFVIPYRKANPNQQIKVRIMAAVNYHTGAFFLEFMTGTSKPRRLFNVGEGPDQQRMYLTKQGKKAKATVQEEFEDVMRILHEEATSSLRVAMNNPKAEPLYIFDNVAMQKKSSARRIGYSRFAHVKIPPHSPDFNKPIEHSFNQIKRVLLEKVNENCDLELTNELAQEWVLDAFNNITTESLQRDILSLRDTWLIVSTPAHTTCCTSRNRHVVGSEGDYISVPLYR